MFEEEIIIETLYPEKLSVYLDDKILHQKFDQKFKWVKGNYKITQVIMSKNENEIENYIKVTICCSDKYFIKPMHIEIMLICDEFHQEMEELTESIKQYTIPKIKDPIFKDQLPTINNHKFFQPQKKINLPTNDYGFKTFTKNEDYYEDI